MTYIARRLCWKVCLGVGVLAAALALVGQSPTSLAAGRPVILNAPIRLAGGAGRGGQRDADVFASVAYNPSSQRYLVVWMSARNADSSSAGLDVYGQFLHRSGLPSGVEFRISDGNTAARSNPPVVVAGNGEFLVAWTGRDDRCAIYGQQVRSSAASPDQVLVAGSSQVHSPSLVYRADRQHYVLAYVDGDDYLPPTLAGASPGECGNSPSGGSSIRAIEFHFDRSTLMVDGQAGVSDQAGGAFRPAIAYSEKLAQYLVVWEDRRDAAGQANRFGVRSRLLGSNLLPTSADLALTPTRDYTNDDMSSTWTPRPVVAAGASSFLLAWFERAVSGNTATWSVQGAIIGGDASVSKRLTAAEMTFSDRPSGKAPTGFLSAGYHPSDEYVLALNSHLKTTRGYQMTGRVQRITSNGALLDINGNAVSQAGAGADIDLGADEQTSIAIAANASLLAYSKHAPARHSQDFDIWSVRMAYEVDPPEPSRLALPVIRR